MMKELLLIALLYLVQPGSIHADDTEEEKYCGSNGLIKTSPDRLAWICNCITKKTDEGIDSLQSLNTQEVTLKSVPIDQYSRLVMNAINETLNRLGTPADIVNQVNNQVKDEVASKFKNSNIDPEKRKQLSSAIFNILKGAINEFATKIPSEIKKIVQGNLKGGMFDPLKVLHDATFVSQYAQDPKDMLKKINYQANRIMYAYGGPEQLVQRGVILDPHYEYLNFDVKKLEKYLSTEIKNLGIDDKIIDENRIKIEKAGIDIENNKGDTLRCIELYKKAFKEIVNDAARILKIDRPASIKFSNYRESIKQSWIENGEFCVNRNNPDCWRHLFKFLNKRILNLFMYLDLSYDEMKTVIQTTEDVQKFKIKQITPVANSSGFVSNYNIAVNNEKIKDEKIKVYRDAVTKILDSIQ